MADRIITMRETLFDLLTNTFNTPGEWGHIKSQIGMFRSVSPPLPLPPRNWLTGCCAQLHGPDSPSD